MCDKECNSQCECWHAGYNQAEGDKQYEMDELRSNIKKLEQERDDLSEKISCAIDELA